ncbi:MAG: hypothetical protein KC652_10355 [Cyanobacteria bacterium HKST-UBA01]|nr:hypothetical protein [Cyanobacteria bacterium HKST-UBA01]
MKDQNSSFLRTPYRWRRAAATLVAAMLLAQTPMQAALALAENEPALPAAIAQAIAKQEARIHKGPVTVRKGSRQVKHFVPELSFPENPSDQDIASARVFEEPLVPIGSTSNDSSNKELARALVNFKDSGSLNIEGISEFLSNHPDSPWRASLELNVGLKKLESGEITDAMNLFQSSWDSSKEEKNPRPKALADRSIAELLLLDARLGKTEELKNLFAQIRGRKFTGSNEQKVEGARVGLSMMLSHPEKSFKCGPYALASLMQMQPKSESAHELIKSAKSTSRGTNLTEVKALADKVGLKLQMAKRTKGAAFIVPSVMHWKVGHFAAMVEEKNDRIHLKDPTFDHRGNIWVSKETLEEETDGYFLVREGNLPEGWQTVDSEEGSNIWGKGISTGWDHDDHNCDNGSCDDDDDCGKGKGMASASVFTSSADLSISDIPLSYTPPVGPSISYRVYYNYLETNQPSTFTFSNLGPDWGFDWISYLTLDGSQNAIIRLRGGGSEKANYPYTPDLLSQALLVDMGSGVYHRELPDGTVEVFDQADGSGRIFLTSVIDPQGNSIALQYDTDFRLTTITDAIGQESTISYVSNTFGNSGFYKIASFTDPFSRSASFTYDSTNTHLVSITDVLGLTSQFLYDTDSTFITMMTTPYGTTSFHKYETPYGGASSRGLRIMYPDGSAKVIETWLGGPAITYVWDRHAMDMYPNEPNTSVGTSQYTHAYKTGFLTDPDTQLARDVIGFVQPPLEAATNFSFAGQIYSDEIGDSNKPTQATRTDGQTKIFTYNSLGLMTESIDPLGRKMSYTYDSNGIDLLSVRQTRSGNNDILSQAQGYSQHLPSKSIDGSGNATSFTYNSAGQVLTITDAKGGVTTNTYDTDGYLTQIDGPLSGSNDVTTFTYDGFGRVETITDSEGMTVTYEYDDFNRPTKTTFDDGSYSQTIYDRLDAVLTRDRIGRWTQQSYDSLQQVAYTIDPLGRKTSFKWCTCGSLSALTDAAGNVTRWQHDLEGRTTKKIYPDGTDVKTTYDSYNRVLTVTDAMDQVKNFSYFTDDTLSSISYSNAVNPTSTESFTYDANYNRLATAQNGWGTITYAYNPYITDASAVESLWLGGIPQTGDLVNVTVVNATLSGGKHNVQYTVTSGDTSISTLAGSISTALNADSTLSTAGITATNSGAMISLSAGAIGTVSTVNSTNAATTETVGGSPTDGDVLRIKIIDSGLTGGSVTKSYTVGSSDSLADIASGLASAINGDSNLSSIGVSASSSSAVVTISSTSVNATTYSQSVSYGASETLTQDGGASETATAGGGGMLQSVANNVITDSKITYAYDELGRTTNRSINGVSNAIHWTYDAMSRVTAELNKLGQFEYSYVDDSSGTSKGTTRLASIAYPNGQITNYDWYGNTGDQRLKEIENLNSSSAVLSKFNYAYNPTGEITEWIQQQGSGAPLNYAYKYDLASQLVSAQAGLGGQGPAARQYFYNYDKASNRTGVQKNSIDTATLGGTVTAGDTISITVNDESLPASSEKISYVVGSGDSLADIAAELSAAITANSNLQSIGVNATSVSNLIRLHSASPNITTFEESLSSGATETVTMSTVLNGVETAIFGGTPTNTDVLTITVHDNALAGGVESVNYTVGVSDDLEDIASGFASAINGNTNLSSIGVTASSLGEAVNIKSQSSNFTSYSKSLSGGATETIELALNANGIETVAIDGNITDSDILTLTVFDAGLTSGSQAVTYTVGSSDTLEDVAAGLAAAINGNSNLSAIGVSATARSTVVNLSSVSLHLTTYGQSVSTDATERLTLAPAACATRYDYNNVNALLQSTAGGAIRVEGSTNKAVKSSSIGSNLITIKQDRSLTRYSSSTSNSGALSLSFGQNVNGTATGTVSGATTSGVELGLKVSNDELDTKSKTEKFEVAAASGKLAKSINDDSSLQEIGVNAKASGSNINLSVTETTYSGAISDDATEILSIGDSNLGNTTGIVGGTPTTGDVLSISVHDARLSGGVKSASYTVLTDDTLVDIAAGLVSAINSDSDLSSLGVSASNAADGSMSDTKEFCASIPVASGTNPLSVNAIDGGDNSKVNNLNFSVHGPGTRSFTFDLNGNMTSDGVYTYEWDAKDRLIKITYPGTNNFTDFTFDPFGRNVKIIETESGSVTSTKQFVWCEEEKCEERDAASNVTQRFFARGEQINSSKYFYKKDHLGSICTLTDSNGDAVARYDYTPFGIQTKLEGTVDCDFGFAGMYRHSRSDLNLTLFRAYNPSLARWLSRDPIEELGNLFEYVDNNPVLFTDRLGLLRDATDSESSLVMPPLGKPIPWSPKGKACWDACRGNLPVLGPLLTAGGLPILPTGTKLGGTTAGTSIISSGLRGVFGGKGGPYWAPTFRVPWGTTPSLGGAIGRWAPIVGAAVSAVEYNNWMCCISKCIKGKSGGK